LALSYSLLETGAHPFGGGCSAFTAEEAEEENAVSINPMTTVQAPFSISVMSSSRFIRSPRRRLRPNVVAALPRGVDQQETERLRRAQITNLVLVAGRHGAESSRRHRNGISAVFSLVADFTQTRDHEKQIPCSRVEVRRKLLPRVHTKEACFGFGHLMEHGLRTISVHVASCFGEHIRYRDDFGSVHLFPSRKLNAICHIHLPAQTTTLEGAECEFRHRSFSGCRCPIWVIRYQPIQRQHRPMSALRRKRTFAGAVGMSAMCRFCCKSPKSQGDNFSPRRPDKP
jgi:hypothetical protein